VESQFSDIDSILLKSAKSHNRPCFEGNDPNPYLAAKRDGNREVMMQIYNFMGTANERTN